MGYIPISFITAVVFFIIPIQIQLPHISKSAVRLQQFSGFGTEPILNRKKPFLLSFDRDKNGFKHFL